jgi:AcrR family transcriptional regulator
MVTSPAPGEQAAARERNRRGQGGRLRADIVGAARELLDETGDEQAVTLRAVARRVGIAAPSIYPHFSDRQSILLAVVQEAFEELRRRLLDARAEAGADPVARLRATCSAYLDFARARPQRYRVMFGGLWSATEAVQEAAITDAEAAELGQDALAVFVTDLQECVAAGRSTSADPRADAVALWVALHGLAHQRAVAPLFPWPADIADRLVGPLAQLR